MCCLNTCICKCIFCDSDCVSIECLSPRYIMEYLLCPAQRQFALCSVSLYKWDCINNRYCHFVMFLSQFLTFLSSTYLCSLSRCNNHYSSWRGTLFACVCPRNNLFSEQGLVEYECWEWVDMTEQMWVVQWIHLPSAFVSQPFPQLNPFSLL